jgi:asparagine synthase (glutamine-hydrolysing)
MVSAGGRFVMAYNGEVYNFRALRAELESKGARFRGHSDTEIMLAAFEAWGRRTRGGPFIGMFALRCGTARSAGCTSSATGWGSSRFTGLVERGLLFGSELTALRRHPAFSAGLDPNAVASFLRWNYVPAPHAVFRGSTNSNPAASARSISRRRHRGPRAG